MVVEGPSDKGFIQGVAERLGLSVDIYVGYGNRPGKVSRLIRSTARERPKVIVLKDLHRYSESTISRTLCELRRVLGGLNVYFMIVRRCVESWILAGLGFSHAEEVEDPEGELDRELSRKGMRYVKSPNVTRRLAHMISLEDAMRCSGSFKSFVDKLLDP